MKLGKNKTTWTWQASQQTCGSSSWTAYLRQRRALYYSEKYKIPFMRTLCEYRKCCILIIFQISSHDSHQWHINQRKLPCSPDIEGGVCNFENLSSLEEKFQMYVPLQKKGISHFKLRPKDWVNLSRSLYFSGYRLRLSIWAQSLMSIFYLEAY